MSSVADIVELDEARSKRARVPREQFETAGDMLRAVRETSGLSLEQVSAATNVREIHLENIEAMDIEALPTKAYTIGFVKSYAQFLDLPVDPLVERFKEQAGYGTAKMIAPEVHMRPQNDLSGGKELSLLAVIAVVFFVIWCAFQITRPAEDPGPLPFALDDYPIQQRNIAQGAIIEGEEIFVASTAPAAIPINQDEASVVAQIVEATETETETETELSISDAEATASVQAQEVGEEEISIEPLAGAAPSNIVLENIFDPAVSESVVEEVPTVEVALDEALPQEAVNEIVEETPAVTEVAVEVAVLNEAVAPEIVESEAPITTPETPEEPVNTDDLNDQLLAALETEETPIPASITNTETPLEAVSAPSDDTVLIQPIALKKVAGSFPENCRGISNEEVVVVRFDIDTTGAVLNQRIANTTNACFNAAALTAIQKWEFNPAIQGTEPIPTTGRTTEFRFNE